MVLGYKARTWFRGILTPALSPSEGERENYPPSRREPVVEDVATTVESFRGQPMLFPLPRGGGEGQGEGASPLHRYRHHATA